MLDCVLPIQNSTPLVGIDLGSTTAKLVLVEQGRVGPGSRLLLTAFGGGLTWGGAVLEMA